MNLVSSNPLIAIITDFGELDPYVGIMKGVIAKIAPGVPVIDITHQIPPGDIKRAAVSLWQSRPHFPNETVFLVVVDPGVGTARRGIIARYGENIFIGPDNGVFTFVVGDNSQTWMLEDQNYQLPDLSATFHGRDIFAPAAAFAAKGVPEAEFGSPSEKLIVIPKPTIQFERNKIIGEVLYSDHFGNILTSLGCFSKSLQSKYSFSPWLPVESKLFQQKLIDRQQAKLQLPGGRNLSWFGTFAEVPGGECGVLVGSSGLLEVVANKENAANLLRLSEGEQVALSF
jgi:S-adenosylmethionine hydrolase